MTLYNSNKEYFFFVGFCRRFVLYCTTMCCCVQ